MTPKKYVQPTAIVIETLAEDVLQNAGVHEPPVNVEFVAALHGLDYELVAFERTSGGYLRTGPATGRALISSKQHRLRRRFTMAHELAHHLMDEDTQRVISLAPTAYRGRDRHWPHEFFAACLLMPRAWLGALVRDSYARGFTKHAIVDHVAYTFDVSRQAAEVRLRELGHFED